MDILPAALGLGGSDHSSWEHRLCSVWTLKASEPGLGAGRWWVWRQTQEGQRDGLHCHGRAPGATSEGFERPWYCVPFSHTPSGTQSYQLSHPHCHQTEPRGRNRTRGDMSFSGAPSLLQTRGLTGPPCHQHHLLDEGLRLRGLLSGPCKTLWQSNSPACRSRLC